MSHPLQIVATAISSAVFMGLVSFFIAVLSQRKYHKETTLEAMKTHIEIHHSHSITEEITRALLPIYKELDEEKKKRETVESDIKGIRGALAYLVMKQNGNPKDYGLL